VSPTYEASRRFLREYSRLTITERRRFREARRKLVAALRESPPRFPPELRIKRVQGVREVWELTFAGDGRATFAYGPAEREGEAHVVWRRIGGHEILGDP
jgi:hypothetical protein